MAVDIEISKRVVLVNSTSAIVTRVLRVTVLVWMYQYLLRRISADQFAMYAVVTAVIVFAPLFSSLFTSGVSRYVVEAYAKGNRSRAAEIVSSIFPMVVGWSLVLGVLGCLFAWNIERFLNVRSADLADARLMMGLLVVDFALQMALTPFGAGFAVRQRFLLANIVEIGVELLRMSVLFGLLFGAGPRVLWVVVASVTANAVGGAVKTVLSLRLLPGLHISPRLFRWATARELLSFGVWTSLNHLAGMIHVNADIILLNRLATPVDVAVFKLGSEFYNQVNTLVVTAGLAPMIPVLTSLHARGEKERLGEAVLRSARYIMWFSLIMVIPLIVFRYQLITLYAGANYRPAADVLGLLLLLFFVMPAGFLLAPVSEAAGRNRGLALANTVIQVVKLGVTITLVRVFGWGALGCALSTVVVVGLSHLLILSPMALHMAGLKWRRYIDDVLLRGAAPALAGGVIWGTLRAWITPDAWFSLGLCFAIGAIVYVAVLLAVALSDEERRDLLALLKVAGGRVFFASSRATPAIGVQGGPP